jgi:hypothetical protein
VDRRYFADSPKVRQLLPSLGRQCFYDGDILQQFLWQPKSNSVAM